jgi:uncharacterized protein
VMTFAWYAHLKTLNHRAWWIAALVSWGIALFEYLLQVPANRIGYTVITVPQLKILQELITLAVFVPFAVLYLWQGLKLDYERAGMRGPCWEGCAAEELRHDLRRSGRCVPADGGGLPILERSHQLVG